MAAATPPPPCVAYGATIALPAGNVAISSLANVGSVRRASVVGSNAPLEFQQNDEGLRVGLPQGMSHEFGVALKIEGNGLV